MRQTTRALNTAVVALCVVALTACGGGDGGDGAGKRGATAKPTKAPEPSSSWSTVALPGSALQGGTAVAFSDSLGAGPGGPPILFGTRSRPGHGAHAVIWPASGGKPVLLDVPASAQATALVADQKRTVAIGSSVTDGRLKSWVQTSTDRRTWAAQALPAGLAKADAILEDAVGLDGGNTLLLALDAEHQVLAEPTGGGDLVTLPKALGSSRYQDVQAASRQGRTILVVAQAQKPDGATVLVGLRSTDSGHTWKRTGAPRAPGATVVGMTTSGGRFVATGFSSRSVSVTAAWSTTTGSTWSRESVPTLPRADPEWDAYLSAPVTTGGTVYSAGVNSVTLAVTVLRRQDGRWTRQGDTSGWTTPGAAALVAPGPSGVTVARSVDGKATIGRLTDGRYLSGKDIGTSKHVGHWTTPALFDGRPDVPFERQVVHLRPNGSWDTTYTAQALSIRGDRATTRRPQPTGARSLANVTVASDPDGSTVVMGTDIHFSDAVGQGDDADLVGFYRSRRGGWKQVTGLAGPRTEQLAGLFRLGRTWVALGFDRPDFNGGTHQSGAVWASKDGRRFIRQSGSFDVNRSRSSTLRGACSTPGGGLVVVGSVADPARGGVPIAFQRSGKTWKRLDLGGLGTNLQSLTDCVSAGKVILLQGRTSQGSGLWRSTDLKSWDKVTIGGRDDTVTTVRPVPGGFAAAGGRYGGRVSQPVVWLSTDGRTWTSVGVPAERALTGSDVVESKAGGADRLVVLLNGTGGPEVQRLDNFTELLAYAAKQG